MASVLDVAAYILQKNGRMDTWRLQKLVYYAQAWSLAWSGDPLFPEAIEAWRDGPVAPALFERHRGVYETDRILGGDPKTLGPDERAVVDAVLGRYGRLTGTRLRQLTHKEHPWQAARGDLPAGEPSGEVISRTDMRTYYADRIAGLTKRLDSGPFYLMCLASQITPENRHPEIATGPAVGREWG